MNDTSENITLPKLIKLIEFLGFEYVLNETENNTDCWQYNDYYIKISNKDMFRFYVIAQSKFSTHHTFYNHWLGISSPYFIKNNDLNLLFNNLKDKFKIEFRKNIIKKI